MRHVAARISRLLSAGIAIFCAGWLSSYISCCGNAPKWRRIMPFEHEEAWRAEAAGSSGFRLSAPRVVARQRASAIYAQNRGKSSSENSWQNVMKPNMLACNVARSSRLAVGELTSSAPFFGAGARRKPGVRGPATSPGARRRITHRHRSRHSACQYAPWPVSFRPSCEMLGVSGDNGAPALEKAYRLREKLSGCFRVTAVWHVVLSCARSLAHARKQWHVNRVTPPMRASCIM